VKEAVRLRPARPAKSAKSAKPTPDELGIDLGTLTWVRSGEGDGSIEVAFPLSHRWARGDWVLLRVAGGPAGRILVFDRNEWECFIDGARNGEFDEAADTRRGIP
jgi:Domain of unknown function (DUF397)